MQDAPVHSTPTVRIGPGTTSQAFAQTVTGLAPNATTHLRVVLQTDFVTAPGADQHFATLP